MWKQIKIFNVEVTVRDIDVVANKGEGEVWSGANMRERE
jgi:hypothetical protein